MSEIRELRVVEADDHHKPPHIIRRDIARMLRSTATVAAAGASYRRGDVKYAPIRAAVLVAFDADGEPNPLSIGLEDLDPADRAQLIQDAAEALRGVVGVPYMRHALGRAAEAWEEEHGEAPTSRLQLVRWLWQRTEQRRTFFAQKDAADKAAHEAEFPILCDCGHRCRTLGGLKQHQRGRSHRWWQSRQEQSS